MAGRLIDCKGTGDFEAGAGTVDGDGVAMCVDCADQDEAYALALAYYPATVSGIPRATISVKDQGGDIYLVNVKYKSGVPDPSATDAGAFPAGGREPAGGANPDDEIGRDVSFNATSVTRKVFRSLETRHKIAKAGDNPPDFGGLIGVNLKDGSVDGAEALMPQCDFQITKRFEYLSLGWFYSMMSNLATTNDAPWLGMDADEVLFKGMDGTYKDGDSLPWSVVGHFGFSRNLVLGENIDPESGIDPLVIGELEIPDIRGWEVLWVAYAKAVQEDIVLNGETISVLIEYPRWAYVERIYRRSSMSDLGLD